MAPYSTRLVLLIGSLLWSAATLALAEPPQLSGGMVRTPGEPYRFYHVEAKLSPSDRAFVIERAEVNGNPEMFLAFVNGRLNQYRPDGGVNRKHNGHIPADTPATLLIRFPWAQGEPLRIVLHCKEGDEENGTPFDVSAEAPAPDKAGFPFPGWKEHRVLVLREDYGMERVHEPFLFFLSEKVSKVRSWKDELRVARLDIDTGKTKEVPSQVLYEKRAFDTPKQEDAYTTCQVAVLADVPADGKAYYLIAYGNPEATAPQYTTDLKVRNEESGAVFIDNDFYEAQIHAKSGQLNGLTSKKFGSGKNKRFGYMPDSGYPLHYNPDVWVRNREWTHTKGWNPPPKFEVEAGPVAVVTRRWGHLPRATEVEVQVVYHFFSQSPYVLVESTMDILQDVVVNALRNEEVVFSPSTEVDHAGWKRANGEMGYVPMVQQNDLTPGIIQILEADAPFVCLARETDGLGMASLRLSQHAGSRGADPAVVSQTATVLADYGWDFRYWSRALVYPWGDYVPDEPTVINAGTYYGERSAFCLFPLGSKNAPEKKLSFLNALHAQLTRPLRVDHEGAGPW